MIANLRNIQYEGPRPSIRTYKKLKAKIKKQIKTKYTYTLKLKLEK